MASDSQPTAFAAEMSSMARTTAPSGDLTTSGYRNASDDSRGHLSSYKASVSDDPTSQEDRDKNTPLRLYFPRPLIEESEPFVPDAKSRNNDKKNIKDKLSRAKKQLEADNSGDNEGSYNYASPRNRNKAKVGAGKWWNLAESPVCVSDVFSLDSSDQKSETLSPECSTTISKGVTKDVDMSEAVDDTKSVSSRIKLFSRDVDVDPSNGNGKDPVKAFTDRSAIPMLTPPLSSVEKEFGPDPSETEASKISAAAAAGIDEGQMMHLRNSSGLSCPPFNQEGSLDTFEMTTLGEEQDTEGEQIDVGKNIKIVRRGSTESISAFSSFEVDELYEISSNDSFTSIDSTSSSGKQRLRKLLAKSLSHHKQLKSQLEEEQTRRKAVAEELDGTKKDRDMMIKKESEQCMLLTDENRRLQEENQLLLRQKEDEQKERPLEEDDGLEAMAVFLPEMSRLQKKLSLKIDDHDTSLDDKPVLSATSKWKNYSKTIKMKKEKDHIEAGSIFARMENLLQQPQQQLLKLQQRESVQQIKHAALLECNEEEIVMLQQNIERLMISRSKERKAADSRIRNLELSLDEEKSRYEDLQALHSKLAESSRKECVSLQQSLDKQEAEMKSLRKENQEWAKQKAMHEERLASLESLSNALAEKTHLFECNVKTLTIESSKLRDEKLSLQEQMKAKVGAMDRLQADLEKTRKVLSRNTKRVKELECMYEKTSRDLTESKARAEGLALDLEAAHSIASTTVKKVEKLQLQEARNVKAIDEYQDQVRKLEEEVLASQSLAIKISDAELRIEKLSHDNEALQSTKSEQNGLIVHLEAENSRLKSREEQAMTHEEALAESKKEKKLLLDLEVLLQESSIDDVSALKTLEQLKECAKRHQQHHLNQSDRIRSQQLSIDSLYNDVTTSKAEIQSLVDHIAETEEKKHDIVQHKELLNQLDLAVGFVTKNAHERSPGLDQQLEAVMQRSSLLHQPDDVSHPKQTRRHTIQDAQFQLLHAHVQKQNNNNGNKSLWGLFGAASLVGGEKKGDDGESASEKLKGVIEENEALKSKLVKLATEHRELAYKHKLVTSELESANEALNLKN